MTSTLPPLVQAFSGAIGSATANATVYPLDLVITRLQTSKSKRIRGIKGAIYLLHQIIHKHGLSALYDGLETDTGATIISGFLYYYFYSFLRSLLTRRRSKSKVPTLSVAEELGLGFAAGLASKLISTPLSVVTVRLQTEREDAEEDEISYNKEMQKVGGVKDVIGRIYEEDGLVGFWRGFSSTVPLALTPSLTLFFFQLFRDICLPRKNRERPTSGQAFIGGAIAQCIATTCLYPLMLAKTRIQTARSSPPPVSTRKTSLTILQIWTTALQCEGLNGLYQGLEAQVIKGVVSQGVTLMIKTRIEQLVVQMYLRRIRKRP
ncbi:hypothetical protein PILCRDRAFT_820297 [Piloderma croceum F 1598]|uniref:Mitochondrial carrier n=1 Tax=Piloderma croceum (strain F 1598) TaxID=765440 RepID=A0A0C3FRS6_PILCF|nr:hypothetical protein PILCRDRAFT_820297 [Piloderma croceum F 1598]